MTPLWKRAAIALVLLTMMWLGAVLALLLALPLVLIYKSPWAKNVWRALDVLVNVAFFNGLPCETMSQRAGKMLRLQDVGGISAPYWARWIDKQTNRIDDNHARDSVKELHV